MDESASRRSPPKHRFMLQANSFFRCAYRRADEKQITLSIVPSEIIPIHEVVARFKAMNDAYV